jgi:hypothetical protein
MDSGTRYPLARCSDAAACAINSVYSELSENRVHVLMIVCQTRAVQIISALFIEPV